MPTEAFLHSAHDQCSLHKQKKSSPPLPQKKTKRKDFKYTKDYAFGVSESGSLSEPPLRLAAS